MNTKYFGETLEGTGQAEDYRLKLSPKSEPTIRSIVNKKPVNEFLKTHLLAILLELYPNLILLLIYLPLNSRGLGPILLS